MMIAVAEDLRACRGEAAAPPPSWHRITAPAPCNMQSNLVPLLLASSSVQRSSAHRSSMRTAAASRRQHECPGRAAADVVVIGGGAAGLLAAITAGRRGRRVVVLEKNADIGKKIRISGGGRCNFTNISPDLAGSFHSSACSSSSSLPPHSEAHSFDDVLPTVAKVAGSAPATSRNFVQKALERYPPDQFIALVEKHGIGYHEKKLGQLFCDKSAQQIIEMLRKECRAASVDIRTNCHVTAVRPSEQDALGNSHHDAQAEQQLLSRSHFSISWQSIQRQDARTNEKEWMDEPLTAESVIIASGGLSFARACGSTDLAHKVASEFSITLRGIRPGLVPVLIVPEGDSWIRELTGVSLPDVGVSIGGSTFTENLLFTHRGLSGPAVLQASSFLGPGAPSMTAINEPLIIDLFPKLSENEVFGWLQARAEACRAATRGKRTFPVVKELCMRLPKRFAHAFWSARARPAIQARYIDEPLADLPQSSLHCLAHLLKAWDVHVEGTEGYPKAEVTCGGVATEELNDETMETVAVPGLYFIGEAVDVTGWLGGYNFQWAWSSGYAAGSAV